VTRAHSYRTPIYFDDLDPTRRVHNARYGVLMERAVQGFLRSTGRRWQDESEVKPDVHQVVREIHIQFHAPIRGADDLRIDVGVAKLSRSGCVYTFRFLSEDGSVLYAEGRRSVVKIDPESGKPLPWTQAFRDLHAPLLAEGATGP
jgi:acyl-CoA thioester hydrolase